MSDKLIVGESNVPVDISKPQYKSDASFSQAMHKPCQLTQTYFITTPITDQEDPLWGPPVPLG